MTVDWHSNLWNKLGMRDAIHWEGRESSVLAGEGCGEAVDWERRAINSEWNGCIRTAFVVVVGDVFGSAVWVVLCRRGCG
jgi:hypothetical protein